MAKKEIWHVDHPDGLDLRDSLAAPPYKNMPQGTILEVPLKQLRRRSVRAPVQEVAFVQPAGSSEGYYEVTVEALERACSRKGG